jgi:hypothetical protein
VKVIGGSMGNPLTSFGFVLYASRFVETLLVLNPVDQNVAVREENRYLKAIEVVQIVSRVVRVNLNHCAHAP